LLLHHLTTFRSNCPFLDKRLRISLCGRRQVRYTHRALCPLHKPSHTRETFVGLLARLRPLNELPKSTPNILRHSYHLSEAQRARSSTFCGVRVAKTVIARG